MFLVIDFIEIAKVEVRSYIVSNSQLDFFPGPPISKLNVSFLKL